MTAARSNVNFSEPDVDVIIAVHTDQRPIERAVGSVLSGTKAAARTTIVCHGVDVALIAARLGYLADDPRVRLLPFTDGVPSPAGPFNHGLDAATARFTSVLGSDDELEPGAIDSWLAFQRRDDAHVIIPAVRLADGGSLGTPPTRPFRRRGLEGARDRLAYRTAQLGLVDRRRFAGLRFTPDLASGEDIAYGLRLWFSDARIAFDRRGPSYRINADATDRTTVAIRTIAQDFAFLDHAIDPEWIVTLTPASREAIAIKLLRTHVIDALRSRFLGDTSVNFRERQALAAVLDRIVGIAPPVLGIMSTLDRQLLHTALDPSADEKRISTLLRRRTVRLRPSNLVTGSPLSLLHREAPLRFYGAVFIAS